MNRSYYFNYIENKLQVLSNSVATRGKLNVLDYNIYSETFFANLLNMIFNFNLENMNTFKQNIEGIDLIDNENKIIAQVSSTSTKQKIEKSLEKEIFNNYPGYRFYFISIAREAENLRKMKYKNPNNVLFNPKEDIIDVKSILDNVLNMHIDKQKAFFEFIKKELGEEPDIFKVDTNLATIINILASEKLSEIEEYSDNSFEINRKIEFNSLESVRETIDDYKIFYIKLDEKYTEFDKIGANKSFSVLQAIRKQYVLLQNKEEISEIIFFNIIDNVIDIILKSNNYVEIPYEELEMCVQILVVDAFIRCKIFKNPEGYNHVVTR
ncbi:ABC-three component system protein [Oceanotoga teriensis]|nr:ABC-three component system protein [Oceanotoga teriensis]